MTAVAAPVACVVDASVAIKVEVSESDSPIAADLFAHLDADPSAAFFVPGFFFLECGNILRKHTLRGTFGAADARQKLGKLQARPFRKLSTAGLAADALRIALAHGLTTYDACYVAASEREHVPLITADVRLVRTLAGTSFTVLLLGSLTIPPPPP